MRNTRYMVALPLAGSLMLAGCGGSNDTASSSTSTTQTTKVGSNGSTTVSSSTACPTENTRSFAKTRFVGDVGLAAGTFHRYIYKPYKAGKFEKGASGRNVAIAKAGATALLDAKWISNATKNAKANPTLCKTLATPLSQLSTQLDGLKGQITAGNLGAIATTETLVQKVLGGAKNAGMPIKETVQN